MLPPLSHLSCREEVRKQSQLGEVFLSSSLVPRAENCPIYLYIRCATSGLMGSEYVLPPAVVWSHQESIPHIIMTRIVGCYGLVVTVDLLLLLLTEDLSIWIDFSGIENLK